MTLDLDAMYRDMTGQGELWLSAAGLPLRQIVVLNMPDEQGDQVNVRLTSNFTNWGPLPTTLIEQITPTGAQVETGLLHMSFALGGLVLTGLYLLYSRVRLVHIGVVIAVIVSLIVTPILQAAPGLEATIQRLATERDAQTKTDETMARNELPSAKAEAFHPLRSPQENRVTTAVSVAAMPGATGASALFQAPNYTSGADTDGDGLNDDVEIYKLGTDPGNVDTDGDTLSDWAEVVGYQAAGKTWYLDPLKVDTNRDGLPDNQECPQRINVDSNNNLLADAIMACPDADGDGVPDVYDFDNDGDQVPDRVDTSPNYTGAATTQAQSDLTLTFADYTADLPLNVTLEVRPPDESQLYLANNVYDWPNLDTEGQVTRVFTNTLADFGYTHNQAQNGDVIVTPELEITIPWDPATPTRNLPISGTVPLTATTPITAWLDQGYLNEFGITAEQLTDGTLVLHAPLYNVEDIIGGRIVAWQANLPYLPKNGTWGSNHQVKLAWKVFALLDSCDFTQAPPDSSYEQYCAPTATEHWTTSIAMIQRYYEPFQLTGMSVTEDAGVKVAMIADDSALSAPYEQNLWHLADNLSRTFIQQKTLNGNRFDLDQIVARFADGSAASATERWGIPANVLTTWTQSYPNTVRGENDLIETQVGSFLRSAFPGAGAADAVTVLHLREEQRRTAVLTDAQNAHVTFDNGTKTLNAAFGTGVNRLDTLLIPALSWRPFQYNGTAGQWESAEPDRHVKKLQTNVTGLLTNANLDAIAGSGLTDYTAARKGVQAFLGIFYSAFLTGKVGLPVMDGTPLAAVPLIDANYQLVSGTEPVLTFIAQMNQDLFNLAQLRTTVSLDNEIISLTGYKLIATPAELLQGFGNLVQQNEQATISWRQKRTISTGVGAFIAGLGDAISGSYFHSNSAIGFKAEGVGSAAVGLGALLYAYSFYFQAVLPESQKDQQAFKVVNGIAMGLFITGSVAEVARTVSVVRAYRAAKFALTGTMLLQDTIRINNTIVNSIQDVTGRAAKWALIFDVLINIGVFLFTVFYNKLEVGSIGFNVAMSQMIVGIAVSILLFALAIVSVVATIFLALLALVDVILLAICNFDNRAPDSFVCRGLLGSFTQAVADLLYKYTVPIQLSRSDRLALNVQSATLSDEAKGYSVGNQVNLTSM
ncbi:MAG: hypothetical protein R2867_26640 [Caldilineaceae bacterium]